MKFYVVNATSSAPLAILNCSSFDEADSLAFRRFGDKVIVIDEALYALEREVGYQEAGELARQLFNVSREKKSQIA